jgi:hypothetical protein
MAAHIVGAVVERGLEQRLVGQAQPRGQRVDEHDALGRGGRVPARGDQLAAGGGVAGAQRGQVGAPLPRVSPPPGVLAGRGDRGDELPVRIEPGQPARP